MRLFAAAFMLALVFPLTACQGDVKPTAPAATVIEAPVKTYVPIDPALRARCPWPKSGKPSEAMEVGRKRKECLEFYERNLDGIDKVQGQPVPAGG